MKKSMIFVIAIILVSLLLAGGIGYLTYNLINYSDTMDDYEQIENEKTIVLNNSDQFTNQAVKYSNKAVKATTYKGYEYLVEKDGISFISYVKEWDEEMLDELIEEFFRNEFGSELQYLRTVELYGGSEEDEDTEYHELYKSYEEKYEIPMTYYNFLNTNRTFEYTEQLGSIYIDYSDIIGNMKYMSYFMSKAYGYHFAQKNLGLTFTEEDEDTEYYKLRAEGYDKVKLEEKSYLDEYKNPKWYLKNIAAYDYMYFMGSETTKEITEFYDTKEILQMYLEDGDILDKISVFFDLCRNGQPHINYQLPMPQEVEGLKEYFYSFVEDDIPEYTYPDEPIGDLNITYAPESGDYWNKGIISWDKPFDDADVVYTVLIFDEDHELWFMHKTVDGDEDPEAFIGYYEKSRWYLDTGDWLDINEGDELIIRVSITFPDGTVIISDPVAIYYKKGMKE